MKVGALEIVDCWMEGESEVCKFVTKLEVDKYVPKSLQKHFSEGLHYTDIITYDPKLIACAPYRLPVKSIAPIFPEKVNVQVCALSCNARNFHAWQPKLPAKNHESKGPAAAFPASDCPVGIIPWSDPMHRNIYISSVSCQLFPHNHGTIDHVTFRSKR